MLYLPTWCLFSLFPFRLKRMDMLRSNFLWQGNKDKRGIHLVKWKMLTLNKQQGRLGIKNLRKQNQSLLMEWLWRYSNENKSLSKRVIKEKYGEDHAWKTKTVNTVFGVSVLKTIRNLLQIFSNNIGWSQNFSLGRQLVRIWPPQTSIPRCFLTESTTKS